MSINKLIWSIVVVTLTSNSHADLVGVEIVAGPGQHPDGKHDTWRVVAAFDNETDKLLSVVGYPLLFNTGGGELYNQGLFKGLSLNDFPSGCIGVRSTIAI